SSRHLLGDSCSLLRVLCCKFLHLLRDLGGLCSRFFGRAGKRRSCCNYECGGQKICFHNCPHQLFDSTIPKYRSIFLLAPLLPSISVSGCLITSRHQYGVFGFAAKPPRSQRWQFTIKAAISSGSSRLKAA